MRTRLEQKAFRTVTKNGNPQVVYLDDALKEIEARDRLLDETFSFLEQLRRRQHLSKEMSEVLAEKADKIKKFRENNNEKDRLFDRTVADNEPIAL